MKKKKNKKNRKLQKEGSLWSISFFLATLGNFFLFAVVSILLVVSPPRHILHRESLIAFLSGSILTILILVSTKMSKIRVIVHEVKHAIVVLLTGNKLNKIVANKDDGFVEYQMYEDKLHFAPIISLAPYFFPIFSLPLLFICLIFESTSLVLVSLFLGVALFSDICFGIGDIHPSQSDFKSIFGGFILSKLYLVGFYLFWPTFVYLWIQSGTQGIYIGLQYFLQILLRNLN